jgi:hypothetical protein
MSNTPIRTDLKPRTRALVITISVGLTTSLQLYGQTGWQPCGEGTCVTSGNVGIGTSNPAHKLDVNGSVIIRGNNSLLFSSGTSNGALLTTLSGYLNILSGETGMNIDNNAGTANLIAVRNSGNVGIGTMTP